MGGMGIFYEDGEGTPIRIPHVDETNCNGSASKLTGKICEVWR